jgi:hypothetical protein
LKVYGKRISKGQRPIDGEVEDVTSVILRCVDTSNWKVEGICKIWRSFHLEIFVRKTAHCGDRNRLESLEYHVFKVADKHEMFAKKMDRTLTCSRIRALLIFYLRVTSLQSLERSVVLKTCGCVRGKSVSYSRTREKCFYSYMRDVTNIKKTKLDIYGSVHHDIIYENDQQDATV